jgi:hypothetical protein
MKRTGSRRIVYGILVTALIGSLVASTSVSAQSGNSPIGAFGRMGFGPRGIALGNAANAILIGSFGSYYNPATIAFAKRPVFEASHGILSLDRSMNFAHFTTHIPPAAGFSVSIMNAGVSDIDARNRDGIHTGYLSTSENLFAFAFGLQFTERIAAGLAFKLYYYDLYQDVTSTTLGFDLGIIYRYSSAITFAGNIRDINGKYKWDTTDLYGESGRTTTDAFPVVYQLGGSYLSRDNTMLISMQGEYSKELDFVLRAGIEAYLNEYFVLRGGIDNITDPDMNKPSIGIGITYPVRNWLPSFNYSLVFEPNAPSNFHVLSVGIEF